MTTGDVKRINLSTSSFERLITAGQFYVDKSRLIEHFLQSEHEVQLIARQRRLGKSLNMNMLRCFLTSKKDMRHLFRGLYIETSPVWEYANSAPIFYFDFKNLTPGAYKLQVAEQVYEQICTFVEPDELKGYMKVQVDSLLNNPEKAAEGLRLITSIAHAISGKRAYLLIDEYDNLLIESHNTSKYEEIRAFITILLSSGLKGNEYLEKALLTGVMRISHESILSGLNNIVTHDVFVDGVYTDDYGLTEDEMAAINQQADFDINEVRQWYNGIRIDGKAIYNIYAVMSFLARKQFDCYWGKSGTLDMIISLLNDKRKQTLAKLLNGEHVTVGVDPRISLNQLTNATGNDGAFYSLLIQAGYLAIEERSVNGTARVSIPNRELHLVWQQFILSNYYPDTQQVRTLFDHADNLMLFTQDLEYFLCDRLSVHDLSVHKTESSGRVHERIYHVFLLGILSAYDDVRCKYPLSNRESGDGRYDILVEKSTANFIFEFKAADNAGNLEEKAIAALSQIEEKRYGAEIDGKKPIVKVGIAFHGKLCKVKCS